MRTVQDEGLVGNDVTPFIAVNVTADNTSLIVTTTHCNTQTTVTKFIRLKTESAITIINNY